MSDNLFELSEFEKSAFYYCTLGDYIVMLTTIFESQTFEIEIHKDIFKKACTYLQERHPLLRSYIERGQEKIVVKLIKENYNKKLKIKWIDLSEKVVNREELENLAA
ncbi:unnamed protein product [Brachionus calyciflorus]|uniref:Uncharacterized protein n=1 Tax=Brachionus calyciflorus TaxID=104777 RepID=A0A813VCY6_9BILA|nr:unnamed protein product [Brachionus calyciflorus]